MPVDTPSPEYLAALPKWRLLRDCVGGKDAVLAGGTKYLPQLPGNPEGYNDYAKRGNFYNATRRTVAGLVGAIFQKPPTVEAPELLAPVLADVTPRGKVPFELFARQVGDDVVEVCRAGILVDIPSEPSPNPLPFAVLYKAEDIISWRLARAGSDEVLTRVVLREMEEVEDLKDPFVTELRPKYRVLELIDGVYTVTIWRPKAPKSKEYVPDPPITPERRTGKLDAIPFVFVGGRSVSPDVENPALEDLAHVNIAHWRNSVDLEYGLHLIALPTPWVAGAKDQDGASRQIGPSVVWELDKDGSAGMLEFSGAGLGSIAAAMEEKKKQMASLGARMLEDQPQGVETATAVGMRHAGEHATLRTVAMSISMALTQVVQWLAWWMGAPGAKPSDVKASVQLNTEFFAVKLSPDELRSIVMAWQSEGMSWETLHYNLARGGLMRPGMDAKEERAQIQREAASRPPAPTPQADGDPGDDE